MPSTQEFRRRIKSVSSTKQITKAMEMIASIKMQKSIRTIEAARSYIQNAWNILTMMAKQVLAEDHPLIKPHEDINKTAVILVTSDRGLCGAYNSEVIKKYLEFAKDTRYKVQDTNKTQNSIIDNQYSNLDIIAVGKFGASFVNRHKAGNLVAEFKGLDNEVHVENIIPISKLSNGEYLNGKYDKVVIIYSHFESSLKQTPVVKQILPIIDEHIDQTRLWAEPENDSSEYKFEPDAQTVFDGILKQIIRTQIYGAVLEANASEHSARMVAMKNATDNAKNLIDELTLEYNSIRQNNITREIAEISGAAEAMK